MNLFHKLNRISIAAAATLTLIAIPALAQVPDGPQTSPPPPAFRPAQPEVQKLPQTPESAQRACWHALRGRPRKRNLHAWR